MARDHETAAVARAISSLPPYELPAPDPTTKAFWDAASERRFLVKRCAECTRASFYPRPFCPHCWSEQVHWEEASGAATLYTYSVVRRNDLKAFATRVPYVAALVELHEGPRVMTNLVGTDPGDIEIGMALRVDYAPAGEDAEALVPVFVPAGAR